MPASKLSLLHSRTLFLSSVLSGSAIAILLVSEAIDPGTAFVLSVIPIALAVLGTVTKHGEGKVDG